MSPWRVEVRHVFVNSSHSVFSGSGELGLYLRRFLEWFFHHLAGRLWCVIKVYHKLLDLLNVSPPDLLCLSRFAHLCVISDKRLGSYFLLVGDLLWGILVCRICCAVPWSYLFWRHHYDQDDEVAAAGVVKAPDVIRPTQPLTIPNYFIPATSVSVWITMSGA